ncbi:hypothetical protein BH762_gp018 [Gordonia phage OneUp]|uniref:Uncharacterized protein n=1 Tax=Gordonia phage OneUp TaxID=1838074 RepID=A0A160DEX9_9CAUD|nr:hypothetical protein BH762_gp018 [Gordonia phage OneUp]ANA86500.1 hypothetical protein PBI_ONEUP_167 [Gordonia phage OneUp]
MATLNRDQVAEIARRLAAKYDAKFDDGWFVGHQPTVVPGSHEESSCPWLVSWEECPDYDWNLRDDLQQITREVLGSDWFAEPINSWSVAFFS